jgi:hypothetical protein
MKKILQELERRQIIVNFYCNQQIDLIRKIFGLNLIYLLKKPKKLKNNHKNLWQRKTKLKK